MNQFKILSFFIRRYTRLLTDGCNNKLAIFFEHPSLLLLQGAKRAVPNFHLVNYIK